MAIDAIAAIHKTCNFPIQKFQSQLAPIIIEFYTGFVLFIFMSPRPYSAYFIIGFDFHQIVKRN